MSKFIYKLENVLQLKERMYEQLTMELREISTELADERKVLDGYILSLEKENNSFQDFQGRQLVASELKEKSRKIAYLKDMTKEQKVVVDRIVKKEEEFKQKVIEAYKQKEVYKKLKEKKFEEYIEEEKVKEQNLLDEAVNNRYKAD